MAARVAARRDEDVAPAFDALDFALENPKLGRVADVVGVAAEGLREALSDECIALLARGRLLVERLRSARGGDPELHQNPLHALRLRGVVAPVPLRVVADGV